MNSKTHSRSTSSRRKWAIRFLWQIGFLSPLLWLGWQAFGPPERIVVSHATTHIAGPTTADGMIDYDAALRDLYQKPGAVLFSETPVAKLLSHEAKDFPATTGPYPTFYDPNRFLPDYPGILTYPDWLRRHSDRIGGKMPISKESDPEMFEIMEQNLPWFNSVMQQNHEEAVLMLGLHNSKHPEIPQHSASHCWDRESAGRELASRFRQLARFHFGTGRPVQGIDAMEWLRAWNQSANARDASILDTIAYVVNEANWQELLISLLANSPSPGEQQLIRICQWPIRSDLHDKLADSIDTMERFSFLDSVQTARVDFDESGLGVTSFSDNEFSHRWIRNSIQWNSVLTTQNQQIDRIVTAMRIENYPERLQQISTVIQQCESDVSVVAFEGVDYSLHTLFTTNWTGWMQAAFCPVGASQNLQPDYLPRVSIDVVF